MLFNMLLVGMRKSRAPRSSGVRKNINSIYYFIEEVALIKKIVLILLVIILVPVLSNGAEFKLNDGAYDPRFSSPEKTYALYKKLLLAGDIENATECIIPDKSENYYNIFKLMLDNNKLEEFARGLPDNIRLTSEYDPYYNYEMIAEADGKKFSYLIRFIKAPSGIYLIYVGP